MSFLDHLPVATLSFLAGVAVIVIAYCSNDLSVNEALKDLGFVGVGSGLIGHARNGAGRGVKR